MNSKNSLCIEDQNISAKPAFQQIGSVISVANILDELKQLDQWALWKGELRDNGKVNKVPYRSEDPYDHARINARRTYSSFSCAVNSLIEIEDDWKRQTSAVGCPGAFGLLFALTNQDRHVGIDLDDVINKETGEFHLAAIEIIDRFNCYTEFSPSGLGIRMFTEGELPGKGRNTKDPRGFGVEIYDRGRFLTVTGNVYR